MNNHQEEVKSVKKTEEKYEYASLFPNYDSDDEDEKVSQNQHQRQNRPS